MPAALPIDWTEIRRACEAGMGLSEAARKWGVDPAAVRQRSKRENWIHPVKVAKLAEQFRQQKLEMSPTVTNTPEKTLALTAQEAVTESVAEMGSQLKSVVMQKTLAALRKARLEDLPIASWGDAKTAVEVGLKVSGLESQAGGPSLNVLFTGATAPAIEIDASPSVPRGTNSGDERLDIL